MVIVSELYNHYNELLRLLYQRGLTESWQGREMLFSRFNLRQKGGGKTSFKPRQSEKGRTLLFRMEVCRGK